MNGPIIFSLFALVHLAIGLSAVSLLAFAPVAAICLALVEFATFYDNVVVATGNRLGISAHTERLNRTRFLLHAVCIGFLLPVYAGIGRLAGVEAFAGNTFNILIWVATLAIVTLGYFVGYRSIDRLIPVDFFGCLRYATSVSASGRRDDYEYSAAELAARGAPPLASILTVVTGLGLSIWIGFATTEWIPAKVSALMLLAGAFPPRPWSALATSCLEVVFSAGLLFVLFMHS